VDATEQQRAKVYSRKYMKEWERHPQFACNAACFIS